MDVLLYRICTYVKYVHRAGTPTKGLSCEGTKAFVPLLYLTVFDRVSASAICSFIKQKFLLFVSSHYVEYENSSRHMFLKSVWRDGRTIVLELYIRDVRPLRRNSYQDIVQCSYDRDCTYIIITIFQPCHL